MGAARNYDAILIAHPDLNEAGIDQLKTRFEELVSRQEGRVLESSNLGRRRLGYRIQKVSDGIYLQWKMEMPPAGVDPVRRGASLLESALRLMVVRDSGLSLPPQERREEVPVPEEVK